MSSTLQLTLYTYPSWPWPGMFSGAVSDDLTFLQGLLVPFDWIMGWLLVVSKQHIRSIANENLPQHKPCLCCECGSRLASQKSLAINVDSTVAKIQLAKPFI